MADTAIRLLIVDDEYLVRDLLKYCIDWQEIGYRIVGEAETADEALELIDKLQPDVVLTDIRMPGTDGLDLSVRVKETYPDMKVLILSGHGEFQYAKKAIEAGVDNYLLKPINDEELIQVFGELRNKIREENEERKKRSRSIQAERDVLLFRLLFDQLNVNEMTYLEKEWFPHPGPCRVSVIEADRSIGEDKLREVVSHWRASAARKPGTAVIQDANRRIVIVSDGEKTNMMEAFQSQPAKERTTMGMGNRKTRMAELGDSYREALIALRYAIVTGPGKVIPYSERKSMTNTDSNRKVSAGELEAAIKNGRKAEVLELLEAALKTIDLDREDALLALQMEAAKWDMRIRDTFEAGAIEHPSPIMELRTLREILDYLKQSVDDSFRGSATGENGSSQTVREVRRFLENHFADTELSLTQVAEAFYLNPSYLSRVFKEESGFSFVEYLTKVRMDRALQLLRHTDKRVYEIAAEVGFKDPHYFSLTFKKINGLTPNEYRKKIDH